MFKTRHFSTKEWILFFVFMLIPGFNIGFAIFLLFRIGLFPLLLKLLLAIPIYILLGIIALAIGGF